MMSEKTTHPATQPLGANLVECSTDDSLTMRLIWKWAFFRKKLSFPPPEISQDVLEQTEKIFHHVRKNANLHQTQSLLQPKSEILQIQGTRIRLCLSTLSRSPGEKTKFTDFHWTGLNVVEIALSNKKQMVRKIGTDKKQIFHRMRVRPFTPRERERDVQTTSKELEPDPEVVIKHDDSYARAWESDCGQQSCFWQRSRCFEPT